LLRDTAASIRAVPRQPSTTYFRPVGHISLDKNNNDAKDLDLALPGSGVYWIKGLFVPPKLRSQGLGRTAMNQVEAMASGSPLHAKTLVLDTALMEDELRFNEKHGIEKVRADQHKKSNPSLPFPLELANAETYQKITNHEWYASRGYSVIKVVQNYYPSAEADSPDDLNRTVFMKKDIA
jgi:GNAT superfamily N-acetyltransferase